MTATSLPLSQLQQVTSLDTFGLRAWLAQQFPNLAPNVPWGTLLLTGEIYYAPSVSGTDYYFYQVACCQICSPVLLATCIVQVNTKGSDNSVTYTMLQQATTPLNANGLQLQ